MTYREKQIFFLQLAQLLRSGIGLPVAAEKLTKMSTASVRRVSGRLQRLLAGDRTAMEAFDALRPELGALERSTLSSLARSGRLEFGLQRLAEYFGVLAEARAEMLRQSAYPLVILHLGVLLLNVGILVGPGGVPAYLRETGLAFLVMYGAVGVLALLIPALIQAGSVSPTIDSLLRTVPFFGKARRALAVSRFCGTLDLQLDSGINVIESVGTAAEASRSGLLHTLAKRAVSRLRTGETLGASLGLVRGALPAAALDEILLAEETGELHRVLPRLREEYEREGLQRLRTAAQWLPRILYFGVLGYLGWRIVSFYMGYLQDLVRQIDAL